MQWKSPWSVGYPGWHIECSVMSQKYLGETFDIHGGGIENAFPHHECEIAQAEAETGKPFANYWLHNNMVTINGQKMGKSLGNGVFCDELFTGDNPQLDKAYSPMTVRFFILQSHYRSTLDFSNEALEAAEKGYKRLMGALKTLETLQPARDSSFDINQIRQNCLDAMNDDFNSPIVIANLFEGVKLINSVKDGKAQMSKDDLAALRQTFNDFLFDVLGLKEEKTGQSDKLTNDLMGLVISIRKEARENKDFATSDKIRDELSRLNISVKDSKDGTNWSHDG